jgi:hypothetical protein
MPDESEIVPATGSPGETSDSPPPIQARRVADQPHHLSLILSVAAIVVSLFSWWESHNARLASQSANRAVLEVIDAVLLSEPSQDGKREFELAVKNVGRSPANAISYWWGTEVLYDTPLPEFRYSPHYFNPPNPTRLVLKQFNSEIAPGSQSRLRFSSDLESPGAPKPLSEALIYLYGDIQYKDEASQKAIASRWCFCIKDHKASSCELTEAPGH